MRYFAIIALVRQFDIDASLTAKLKSIPLQACKFGCEGGRSDRRNTIIRETVADDVVDILEQLAIAAAKIIVVRMAMAHLPLQQLSIQPFADNNMGVDHLGSLAQSLAEDCEFNVEITKGLI